MKAQTALLFSIGISCISGCGSAPTKSAQPNNKPEFTHSAISQEIRKGKTTQTDLLSLMGNPDTIYKNKDNNEVWTYTEQTYDPQAGTLGGGITLYGLTGFSSPEATSYNLVIEWTKGNVVRDFTVISDQI